MVSSPYPSVRGGEPDRREELVRLEDLLVAAGGRAHRDPDAGTGVLDALDLRAEEDLHPELLVVLEQLLGHVLVLGRHHAVQELYDGDVDAEVAHHICELDADRPGAGDDDRPGQLVVEDLLLIGHDVLAHLDAGQHPGHRAGGDDEVVERDRAGLAVVERDVHALRAGEGPPAVDLLDLVLLHEEVDALDDAGRHLSRALVRRTVCRGRVTLDAVLGLLVGEQVGELGVLDQRLARDAADVEADAAPVLLLDDGHLLPQLGGADRRDVSTRACTENHDVEVSHAVNTSRSVKGCDDPFTRCLTRSCCGPRTAGG